MTRRRSSSDGSASRTQIVVAAIGAVATLGAAVVGAVLVKGNSGPSSSGSSPTATSSPQTQPTAQVTSWASERLAPPSIAYTFTGQASGLGVQDLVFILGSFTPQLPGTTAPWSVSPPATFAPDGSWTVRWELPQQPEKQDFRSVVYSTRGLMGAEPLTRLQLAAAATRSLASGGTTTSGIRAIAPLPPPAG